MRWPPRWPAGRLRGDLLAGRAGGRAGSTAGELRIGGFGGVDGLVGWLREHRTDVLVDATHPFAARITPTPRPRPRAGAAAAGAPPARLDRRPGDRWHRVPDAAAAAALLPTMGERVFLATGRGDLPVFARLDPGSCCGRWTRRRPRCRPACRVLLDRGPFPVDAERALLAGTGSTCWSPGTAAARRPRRSSPPPATWPAGGAAGPPAAAPRSRRRRRPSPPRWPGSSLVGSCAVQPALDPLSDTHERSNSARTPSSRTGRRVVNSSSTASAAASNVAGSLVGAGRVALRV